jgi:hypothetical protein
VPVDPELYRYLTRADQPFGGNPPPVGPGLFGFNPTSSQPSPFNAMAQTVIPMLADQFRGQVGGFGFTFDGSRSLFDAYAFLRGRPLAAVEPKRGPEHEWQAAARWKRVEELVKRFGTVSPWAKDKAAQAGAFKAWAAAGPVAA